MHQLAEAIVLNATKEKIKIALVESCTGGMLGACITSIPGSSGVFEFGYVAYSNNAKREMLGIPDQTIQRFGVVSDVMAIHMASQALLYSRADIALSVTGVAGPTPGDLKKPVGLVYIGYGFIDNVFVAQHFFEGDRTSIRAEACEVSLNIILKMLEQKQLDIMRRSTAYANKKRW
ncbi:CinA family protein [Rickettsiales endosymbiont of Peranema trichophorum]|uniref:CinA family protein n=1 Tax=Rickettsiales endosymbiont of Peranema trichophorum TaxID=2486577 RepID=UPI0013EE48A1|nr:CinA family protein [Rickettsiales endosymbiont of Peranema trichophorum]